jgi:hypothetical protein
VWRGQQVEVRQVYRRMKSEVVVITLYVLLGLLVACKWREQI